MLTARQHSFIEPCTMMIKKGSSSFYHAFKYLPSPRKEAVYIMYAFCRMIDDAVDEPEKSPYTLDELEEQFIHLDKANGHFIWPALRYLFNHFPITKEPFFTQMKGQRMDFVRTSYSTMEELESYCYHVAGSVGEMLLPVLHDQPNEEVRQAGIALGKAMQIVNIIRDVGEDKRLGRRYIPLELFNQYNYSLDDYHNSKINDAFISVLQHLENRAEIWFYEGLNGISTYPKDSAFTINLATKYYREIVEIVKLNQYDVFNKRAIVSNARKGLLFKQVHQ